MNLDDIIANESVHAKSTVKMITSSHIHPFGHFYKTPIWGSLYVTDRHIGFKGKMKGRLILGIVTVFISIFGFIIVNYLTLSSSGDGMTTLLLSGPYILYSVMIIITSILTLWMPYRYQKELKTGYVWLREDIELEIYETKIRIMEGEKISVFDLETENHEVLRVLNTQSVEFKIADISKLDYHEKIEVLNLRYKSGKMSKELYEEMKKKIPYT